MKQLYRYISVIVLVDAYWARQKQMSTKCDCHAVLQYIHTLSHETFDNNNDENGEEIVPCIGQNMDDTRVFLLLPYLLYQSIKQ